MKASPPQIFKEAETLKTVLSGTLSNSESWLKRQELCELFETLLLTDLDYALDKKVEQDLWNYVFRNPISTFQAKAKEQKNINHGYSQTQLTTLLETASGFYLLLLQKLCCAYDIDLPCHPRDSSFGITREWTSKYSSVHRPRKSSLLYICQYCLVHLGDIARYRGQSLQAETFYRHAVDLVPSNGQPYNQLALLEAASGEKLSTVFFYMRSLAVQHPFPAAATNLQNLFSKMTQDGSSPEGKTRMSTFEYISGFLQFHAIIHLSSDLKKAERMLRQMTTSLPALIIAEKFETWQLVQMVAVCMFAVEHAWGTLEWDSGAREKGKEKTETELLSEDEKKSSGLILDLIANMLHAFLLPVHAFMEPKETSKYYSVPAVKLFLDWLLQSNKAFQHEAFTRHPQIWHGFCKLLNDLEVAVPKSFDYKKFDSDPLPEDWDLQCFLPIKKTQRSLKFNLQLELPSEEDSTWIRAVRLCKLGENLTEDGNLGLILLTISRTDSHCQFKPAQQSEALSEQVMQQIQELTVASNTSSHSTGKEIEGGVTNACAQVSIEHPSSLKSLKQPHPEGSAQQQEVRFKLDENPKKKDLSEKGMTDRDNVIIDKVVERNRSMIKESGNAANRERRLGRQNVAMQAILQQRAAQTAGSVQTRTCNDITKERGLHQELGNSRQASRSANIVDGTHNSLHPRNVTDGSCLTSTMLQEVNRSALRHLTADQFSQLQQQPLPTNSLSHGDRTDNAPWLQTYNIHQSGVAPIGPMVRSNSVPPSYLQTVLPHMLQPTPNVDYTFHQAQLNQQSQQPQQPQQQQSSKQVANPAHTYLTGSSGMMWNYLSFVPSYQQTCPTNSSGHQVVVPSPHLSQVQQSQSQQQAQQPPQQQTQQQQQASYYMMSGQPKVAQLDGLPSNILHNYRASGSMTSASVLNHSSAQDGGSSLLFREPVADPGPHPSLLQSSLSGQGMQNRPWYQDVTRGPVGDITSGHLNLGQNKPSSHLSTSQVVGRAVGPTSGSVQTNNHSAQNSSAVSSAINDLGTSTYSLFNSPWPSGLTMTRPSKESSRPATTIGNGGGTGVDPILMQSRIQSLWSGPGPSPLERLLEQQKQRRDNAAQ